MVEMQHQRHPRTPTHARQRAISLALGVSRTFDAASELDLRIAFLESTLENTGKTGYVLGISGGVDSLVAGKLAQSAVRRLRDRGRHASFVAVRLPYGHQHDEQDAALAVDFLAPDHCIQVDIKMAVDAQREALSASGLIIADLAVEDFIVGNMKARQRMLAQYAIAGAQESLVIGTDQAAEALMGFFTKHGDGAADLVPLRGLTKRRVRALGILLGAPAKLITKVPTADLESLQPLRPDEDAFGVTYDEIDDFLEGLSVRPDAVEIILKQYDATAHKRAEPVAPMPAQQVRAPAPP